MADMVKLGYGCINGFIAQKLLIFAEGCILRKCRQLLGLNFRIGDELLLQCLLLVFVGQKSKCDFLVFQIKMWCALHSKFVQSIKIVVMVEGIGGR